MRKSYYNLCGRKPTKLGTRTTLDSRNLFISSLQVSRMYIHMHAYLAKYLTPTVAIVARFQKCVWGRWPSLESSQLSLPFKSECAADDHVQNRRNRRQVSEVCVGQMAKLRIVAIVARFQKCVCCRWPNQESSQSSLGFRSVCGRWPNQELSPIVATFQKCVCCRCPNQELSPIVARFQKCVWGRWPS